MQCIRPLMANYSNELSATNHNITFSYKNASKETVGFKLPCRKCLPCRLSQAREKAIRCYHEAKMHEDNIFLTLTYDQEHLKSPRLQYEDFQLFMKKLRKTQEQRIPMMVTGEYGEQNKRPHFHALIFNYRPIDEKTKYTSERGDKVSSSEYLTQLWGKGAIEYGDVTIDSANYVARYAAKKLVHGNDEIHDYHPIHKTSSKYGIGRSWIERYHQHTFENGYVVLPNGQKSKIPRYYVDWAKKHKPDLWRHYVTEIQPKLIDLAEEQERKELAYLQNQIFLMREQNNFNNPLKKSNIKERILQQKFKYLQEKLKL